MAYSFSPRATEMLNEHTHWLHELLERMSIEIARRRKSQSIVAPDVDAAFQILENRLVRPSTTTADRRYSEGE